MSQIKLFRIDGGRATEVDGTSSDLEKPLQTLIENNLENLLGVRFVATEHPTGKVHAGRIDTLGLDENNCPVILEYKRSVGESVINQGLYYLNWLMDHQAEFKLLVLEKYEKAVADEIDWSYPRLICIASDFTKFDSHMIQQINRSVELIRYRRFGKDLLLFELVTAFEGDRSAPVKSNSGVKSKSLSQVPDKSVSEWLRDLSPHLRELLDSLEGYLKSLGDDVVRQDLKVYIAFKRIKNFVTVCFAKDKLTLYLRVDPESVTEIPGSIRDVTKIGHWGTGNLELVIRTPADLDRAKPLMQRAYEGK